MVELTHHEVEIELSQSSPAIKISDAYEDVCKYIDSKGIDPSTMVFTAKTMEIIDGSVVQCERDLAIPFVFNGGVVSLWIRATHALSDTKSLVVSRNVAVEDSVVQLGDMRIIGIFEYVLGEHKND